MESVDVIQRPHQISTPCQVVDIGGSKLQKLYLEALQTSFFKGRPGAGPYVPDVFTFSDVGMTLWRDVISLPHWYQAREEVALLRQWGSEIAKHVVPGASLLDLGSGDTSKIEPLLDRIEALQVPITYYSVDLSYDSIVQGLERLRSRYKHITLVGLWGSFDDARRFLPTLQARAEPCFLACLGAEIGNDPFEMAVSDLSSWAQIMTPQDRFLLGIDSTQDKAKIWSAYHDDGGLFHRFVRTGMHYTNKILGREWFKDEDWSIDGVFHDDPLLHRFILTAIRDVECAELNILFKKGDRIATYDSHRNTTGQMRKIFRASGLTELESWQSPHGEIYEYLLQAQEDRLSFRDDHTQG